MKPDGSLLTSDSKSDLIHALESLATGEETDSEDNTDSHLNMFVVVDGMSVVHEVMSAASPKTYKDVADAFTKTIESRCKNYNQTSQVRFPTMISKSLHCWRHNPYPRLEAISG